MTRIKKGIVYLFVCSFLFVNFCKCKQNFSINSDSEDFPVIYGLLNVSDEKHYIKIFKSFLVEGNAYDAVKEIEKYSYINNIEVYLNEYSDINKPPIQRIKMDTTTEVSKDSGLFWYSIQDYSTQILYVTGAVLKKDYLYEIEVKNPQTKNIAKTKVPIAIPYGVVIKTPGSEIISITDNPIEFKFFTGHNTAVYQLLLKFYYSEQLFDNTIIQPKPVKWILGNVSDPNSVAGIEKSLKASSGVVFFQKIAEYIKEDPNVKRRYVDSLVLEVYSAGEDWGLYLQSNLPSTGINQDRLLYSNIVAYNSETGDKKYAMGVFSSAGITYRKYDDLSKITGSKDSLINGRYTKRLLFADIRY
jgi:hypothetical protein